MREKGKERQKALVFFVSISHLFLLGFPCLSTDCILFMFSYRGMPIEVFTSIKQSDAFKMSGWFYEGK